MAHVPFHDCALARYEEAGQARESLLVSMAELRIRADKFVAVVESTATVFAALASHPQPVVEPAAPFRHPSVTGRSPTTALVPEATAAAKPPALRSGRRGTLPYPDALRPGTLDPLFLGPGAGTTNGAVPRAIVSVNTTGAVVGRPFSFRVITTGDSCSPADDQGGPARPHRVH